jgi:hypothetical protein
LGASSDQPIAPDISTPSRRTTLRGRTTECALLDALTAAVLRGESRSPVLTGEAGIGQELEGDAATTALAGADSVTLGARLKRPAQWRQDGQPVPTFGISRAAITDRRRCTRGGDE